MIRIIEGKSATTDGDVHFWLDVHRSGIALVAKHCLDTGDQRLLQLHIVDGKLVIFQQELCAPHLCAAFGIPQKSRPRVRRWSDWLRLNFSLHRGLRRPGRPPKPLDAAAPPGAP